MRNISTLIYLINEFQSELNEIDCTKVSSFPEVLFSGKKEKRFEPSKGSVDNILDFARSYEVMETEKVGYVEMNLN